MGETSDASGPRGRATVASFPPIFVGGAGRSGTTLLRVMLDSHPRIACGPELKVLPAWLDQWATDRRSFGEYAAQHLGLGPEVLDDAYRSKISALLEAVRRRAGKPRVAEKTPNNVFCFGHLARLFPDSPLIHLVRDGRDVVASLLEVEWFFPDGRPVPYTQDAETAAKYWRNTVTAGLRARKTAGARLMEIRYEDLVRTPEPTMRRVLDHVAEPWDEGVLRHGELPHELGLESSATEVSAPVHSSSVGRWSAALSATDLAAVERIAGGLLSELGYA